jgi:hypothetical protein
LAEINPARHLKFNYSGTNYAKSFQDKQYALLDFFLYNGEVLQSVKEKETEKEKVTRMFLVGMAPSSLVFPFQIIGERAESVFSSSAAALRERNSKVIVISF